MEKLLRAYWPYILGLFVLQYVVSLGLSHRNFNREAEAATAAVQKYINVKKAEKQEYGKYVSDPEKVRAVALPGHHIATVAGEVPAPYNTSKIGTLTFTETEYHFVVLVDRPGTTDKIVLVLDSQTGVHVIK